MGVWGVYVCTRVPVGFLLTGDCFWGLFLQLRRNFPTCLPSWKSPPRALRASHSEALLSPAGGGLPGAPLQTLSDEELMIQSAGERPGARCGVRSRHAGGPVHLR